MYYKMTCYLSDAGFFSRSISYKELADRIEMFAAQNGADIKEMIIFDHLSVSRGFALDARFGSSENVRAQVEKTLCNNNDRSIMKRISFYPFHDGICVFFHDEKDPLTGYFKSMWI
jgi:hypothetical protein